MPRHCPVYIGPDAIPRLLGYCDALGLSRFALIADTNTDQVLGSAVEAALRAQGADVIKCLMPWEDTAADARSVYQVLLSLDGEPRIFLAVGSGTITDITRFISHRCGSAFIAVPTAPSVDGFTSIGAPMIIDDAKTTMACHGPIAVFAHLPTLCAAPRPLIAAGVGDMLGKLTSIADWELGHLLWHEPLELDIAGRARAAAFECIAQIPAIASAQTRGITALMEGLIESGFCMLDFGDTRPASGYEHHISHFLEMRLLLQGRRALLHGAKVGVGLLSSASLYQQIRNLDQAAAAERLALARMPSRSAELQQMQRGYGRTADQLAVIQSPFLDMTPERFRQLRQSAIEAWPEILRIAQTVPPPDQIASWLRAVGGPTSAAELGITGEELQLAQSMAHYYRNRFTVAKLAQLLSLAPMV